MITLRLMRRGGPLSPGCAGRCIPGSLLIAMGIPFLLSLLGHSITGWRVYNEEAAQHGGDSISWAGFLVAADFWEQTGPGTDRSRART